MSPDRDNYLRHLLALYCGLPHTAARRPFPADRRIAEQLFDRGVSLEILEAAFLLAIARRTHRDPQAAPLAPIRSLAYFLPVIDEVLRQPPDPGYVSYLRFKVDQNVQFSPDSPER
ncbi:MAG: hypothetical protein ACREXS_04825 [Gammaproteobacteria bacterium]